MAKKKKARKTGRKWKVYVPRTPEPPPLPISRKKVLEAVIARWLAAYHDNLFKGTASIDDIMYFRGMAQGLDPGWRDVMIREYGIGPFDSTDRIKKTMKKVNRVLNRRGSIDAIVILMDWMKVRRG